MIRQTGAPLVGLIFMLSPGLAWAEDQPPAAEPEMQAQERVLLVELAGHYIAMPFPGFIAEEVTGDAVFPLMQSQRLSHDANVEQIDFVPVSESFDDWTGHLSALAIKAPDVAYETMVGSLVAPIRQICSPDRVLTTTISPQGSARFGTYVVMCGQYAENAAGVDEGEGEILLAVVLKTAAGAVKVWTEFRGPAFDLDNSETWPISEAELALYAVELQLRTNVWSIEG